MCGVGIRSLWKRVWKQKQRPPLVVGVDGCIDCMDCIDVWMYGCEDDVNFLGEKCVVEIRCGNARVETTTTHGERTNNKQPTTSPLLYPTKFSDQKKNFVYIIYYYDRERRKKIENDGGTHDV